MPKTLFVITGPTASGKTQLSIDLAKKLETEIISADSRQCFKYLDIGTAKPTLEEQSEIKHHLIDFLELEDNYSAGQFARDASDIMNKLFIENEAVILTGGSGMYIDALINGFHDLPEVEPGIREGLNKDLDNKGLSVLVDVLREKDPKALDLIDIQNPRRVIRALEIIVSSGKKYSDIINTKPDKPSKDYKVIKIGIDRPREELYERINKRTDLMIDQGFIEEAKSVYHKRHLNSLNTLGYKEIFQYLEGKYNKEEAIEKIKQETRRYAKRQLTYLRRDSDTLWLSPEEALKVLTV